MAFNNKSGYFLAQSADEVVASLISKANYWYHGLDTSGYLNKVRESWKAYHGAYYGTDGHRVMFGGDQGELVHLSINHYRNIAQHMLVMVTSTRPTMTARATNRDYKSIAQTNLAEGLLEYYMREKHLEKHLIDAVEYAIVLGSGFIKLEWNATTGEVWDINEETGEPIYEGDVKFTNLSPFDVLFDGSKESYVHDWVVCRTFKNKYDLAAKYPEQSEAIQGLPTKSDLYRFRFEVVFENDTDDVPVYELYHKKTESLPEGRYILYLDPKVILYDGPMPYKELPIYRIAPSTILGTPYGYSPMFDIMPIQDSINALYSTVLTNQNAFGVQNIYVPRGADVTVSQLYGGLNIIEGNAQAGKPEAMNLTQTPQEVFKFIEMLENVAETISGVNSVARGNPEASLRSGNSLALIQSMALQFISGLQQSYVKLIEDTGTGLINMLKEFAQTPRVAAIVGVNNKTQLKEFIGSDVELVNRIVVDMGNPLAQTKAGKVQMAENLLQYQLLKSPEEYFTVLNTGRLDAMTDGPQKQVMLIQEENEKMLSGQEVPVIGLDDHALHIKQHHDLLSDPELRTDADLLKLVLGHIQQHLQELRSVDPALLQILGQQALPPQQNQQQGSPNNAQMQTPPQNQQQQQVQQIQQNTPQPPGQFANMPVTSGQNMAQYTGQPPQ